MRRIKKAQTGTKLTPQQKRAQMDSIAAVRRADIVRKKDSILNRNAAARGMTREQVRAQQEADKKKPNAPLPGLQTKEACKRGESKGSCSTGQSNKGESLKDNKRNGGPVKKAQNGKRVTRWMTDKEYKKETDSLSKNNRKIDPGFTISPKKSGKTTDPGFMKTPSNYDPNTKRKRVTSEDGMLQYLKNGNKIKKAKSGQMIKRADGSYSRRGLWDNIRANRGSGKKPTKQMLQQERKIKAKTKK